MLYAAIVVSPDPVTRAGLQSILQADGGFATVDCARRVADAARLIPPAQPVILIVEGFPEVLEDLEAFRTAHRFPVVVVCRREDRVTVRKALQLGAEGVIARSADDTAELLDVVDRVRRGIRSVCSTTLACLTEHFCQAPDVTPGSQFTDKERQVLELLASSSNRQIAARLHVSEGTAKNQVSQVFRKLGVRTRSAAVAKALEAPR